MSTCPSGARPLNFTLAHVDDVVASFLDALSTDVGRYPSVPTHTIGLLDVVRTLEAFEAMRTSRGVPDLSDPFTKQLYSTYTSYLPRERILTPLVMHRDARGSFKTSATKRLPVKQPRK